MREISAQEIAAAVEQLCVEANRQLPESLEELISAGARQEASPIARPVMEDLCRNLQAAR